MAHWLYYTHNTYSSAFSGKATPNRACATAGRIRPFFLRRVVLLSFVACVLCGSQHVTAQPPVASAGKDFHVALPAIIAGGASLFRLHITGVQSGQVTVTLNETGASQTRFVAVGEQWEITAPSGSIMVEDPSERRSNRSVHITATGLVTANVTYDTPNFTEAYLAIPTSSLGIDYYAISYPDSTIFEGFVLVIATEDTTQVTITPSVTTAGGHDAGFTYSITLGRGEVYQVTPSRPVGTDFTGTRIQATKPVGVLSGNRGALIYKEDATNPLIEQMPPITDWGTAFYSVPLPGLEVNYYKALASVDGTDVFVNGIPLATLNAGEHHLFTNEQPVQVRATAPIALVQFTTHFVLDLSQVPDTTPSSDPSMMMVPPVDSYNESFRWTSPALAERNLSTSPTGEKKVPFIHYVLITAPAAAITSVMLDDQPIGSALTTMHTGRAYYSGIIPIDSGAHSVTASLPVCTQIFGYCEFDAYSLPAGVRVRAPLRSEPLTARICATALDTIIIINNIRSGNTSVEKIELNGIGGLVVPPVSFPFNVPQFSNAAVRIQFDVPNFGTSSGTIVLTLAGNETIEVPVEIIRDSLAIAIAEDTLCFTPATAAMPATDSVITIVNTGNAPVKLTAATFTGPFTLLPGQLPIVLPVGDTTRIRIRFAPQSPGIHTGTVTVIPGSCGTPDTIPLCGERLKTAEIEAIVETGVVVICPDPGYQDMTVTIYNNGGEELTVNSIEVGGNARNDFTLRSPVNNLVIPPGQSLPVTIRFTPTALGNRDAFLRILNSLPPGFIVVDISARKDSAWLDITDTLIDFGNVLTCNTPISLPLGIRNSGTTTLTIDSMSFPGDGFAYPDLTNVMQGTQSSQLDITFTPPGPGIYRDTLTFYASPCGIIRRVILTGVAELVDLSPNVDTLNFGNLPECENIQPRTLQLLNSGTVTDSITSIEITGTAFSAIPVANLVIAQGETAPVEVRFAPNTNGEFTETLTMRFEPCGLERHIVLKGAIQPVSVSVTGDVNLGTLVPNVPATETTTLMNTGGTDIHISAIAITPVPGLRIVSPSPPFTLPPNGEVELEFEYLSASPAGFAATVTVQADSPCVALAPFTIIGSDGSIALRLILPDTTGQVDRRVHIPIRVEGDRPIVGDVVVNGEIRWAFRQLAMFGITTAQPGATVIETGNSIVGDDRRINFRYTGPIPDTGILAALDVLVFLGPTDTTLLEWTALDATPVDPGIVANPIGVNGSFTTLGICDIGGKRFVLLNDPQILKPPVPNPADMYTDVEFELTEAGNVAFMLYDVNGNELERLLDTHLSAGKHRIRHDVSRLAIGDYYYAIRSKNQPIYTILRILR